MSTAKKVIRINFPEVPDLADWLFSIKCFASAMLAIYISLKIGLKNPFWAVGTCFVIGAPFAGATRSKGLYRTIGTVMSGMMVIITLPLFMNYRSLYILVISGYAALGLFISLLDRTPKTYIFMMTGYTFAIVGMQLMSNHEAIYAATAFNTAAARIQEIIIGMCCSSLIHGIFMPRSVGDALLGRIQLSLKDTQTWAIETIKNVANHAVMHGKIASGITEIRIMATHLPFDSHNIRWASDVVHAFHDRLASIIPIISALDTRIKALTDARSKILNHNCQAFLQDLVAWIEKGSPDPKEAETLKEKLKDLNPVTDITADWSDLLLINLVSELKLLIDAFSECFQYRYQIELGVRYGVIQKSNNKVKPVSNRLLHSDWGIAATAGVGIFISTAITLFVWVVADWPLGFQGPIFACIMSSIFAATDNPGAALKMAFKFTAYSVPLAFLYLLVFMQSAHTIEMVILVMAPFFVYAGTYLARPATAGPALINMMAIVGMLMLYDYGSPNIEAYINGQGSQLLGIATAGIVTTILRNASVDRLINRILKATWQDISQMTKSKKPVSIPDMAVRMIDRVNLLAPKLAALKAKGETKQQDLMEDVRVTFYTAHLINHEAFFRENALTLDPMLLEMTKHFNQKVKDPEINTPKLLSEVDQLLYRVASLDTSELKNEVLASLAGIRQDLFPQALFLRATRMREEYV